MNANGRLSLDSVLSIEKNSFSAEFKNGELSICCYDLLKLPFDIAYKMFSVKTETYSIENKIERVTLYQSDSSFIKTYFNKHPQVNRLDVVTGVIYSNSLFKDSAIKIGKTTQTILSSIFKPTELFKKLNRLTVYETEMGDAFTTFIFENNMLVAIRFDSSYDWIRKER